MFQYITVADLKQCRYLSKDLTIPATKLLKAKTFVRFENVSSLQRYIQEASTMQTMWENYSITVSSKLSADLLLQFGIHCGFQVKLLELDVKHRETNLTYLEDVFSEKLPNLEELTIKGKFPTGSIFPNPHRMIGKMEKVQVFNLFAKGWHRLPPLPTGEIIFRSPVIGQLLSAMPNLTKIDYFPDVDTPRDAHRHYSSFVYTLTEIQSLELRKLAEIQHFTLTFLIDTPCLEKFAARNYPLQKLHILVEEEVQSQQLCWFLETYRVTLTDLVIRSATDNSILWPRLIALKNLTLVGVNVRGTDFIASFPELKSLHISQDRVTTVNFAPERSLQVPHTLTCLKIVESVAVNAAFRISDNGLSIVFRDLPFLRELAIVQCVDSNQPTFSDEGITGSKISISTSELSVHPRDLRVLNRNLMRFSHFIGSLAGKIFLRT